MAGRRGQRGYGVIKNFGVGLVGNFPSKLIP